MCMLQEGSFALQKHVKPQRLNRILSLAGLTSRRKADEWIKAGRVRVNNTLVTQAGSRAVWGRDTITVDGNKIPCPFDRIYLMLNKPFGYISSLSDPASRPVVTDLVRDIPQRLFPVGRLDFDSMGLLLLTNDGDLCYRLTHPRYRVPKTYKVIVAGRITPDAVNRLQKGVLLEDGPSGRSKVAVVVANEKQSVLRMTIYQGRTRQVRRMLEAVGYRVVHLIRIGFGTLELGNLKVREYRHLETEEIRSLMAQTEKRQ